MFSQRFLTDKHLRGFDKYKYNAKDTSPLSIYVIHPFWNRLVEIFPMWVAPNLMTFVGWFLLIINYTLLAYYDPDFHTTCNDVGVVRQPIPSWVYAVCGVLHFWSHTLDGLDGKQARRTKSSSALGELFDHGLDSLTVWLITTHMYSLTGTCWEWSIPPWLMFFTLQAAMVGFYACHWEKYITGVLFLPWSYDLSQLGTLVIYIAAWAYGVEILQFHIPPFGITFAVGFSLTVLMAAWVFGIPCSIWNVYLSYKDGSLKKKTLSEQLAPGFALLMWMVLPCAWAYMSHVDILNTETRWVYWLQGILYSNIVVSVIPE
eukprot:m.167506 g.167506  ORF g.167506 m.167506 type:complete len:317 (+) comp38932_c0_seq20:20-970(+)